MSDHAFPQPAPEPRESSYQAPDLPEPLKALLKSLAEPGSNTSELLDQLQLATQPAGAADLLSRAALCRSFDKDMYERLLSLGLTAPVLGFDAFVALPDVRALPRGEAYVIADQPRKLFLAGWRDKDVERQDWNRRLAAYLAEHRPEDVVGRLYHLVLAGAPDAMAFFIQKFDDADEKFDLPRCFSLLSVLEQLQAEIGSDLAAVRLEKQQRYRSRALYANDYYRTNTYQERAHSLQQWDALLTDPARWVFHLHAKGGMGKSMFLRWLIARKLVPRRVACARIDFDDIHTANAVRYPWLLLLRVCEQLNVQLPRAYFTEHITRLKSFAPLLEVRAKKTAPDVAMAGASSSARPDPDAEDTDRHARNVGDSIRRSGAQVLVVLDTLEGVTVGDQFRPVFDMLETLHAYAPSLVCALAGRYDIPAKLEALSREQLAWGEKHPADLPKMRAAAEDSRRLAARISAASLPYRPLPFSDAEAATYLRSRGLTDTGVVTAIVEKVRKPAQGADPPGVNPFTLALLAELMLGRDAMTIAEVASLPNVEYVYLIERVVKRIPQQPLRWIVRYGVLPRRLTPDFIESVLLGPLRLALHGAPVGDALDAHTRTGSRVQEQDIWTPDPLAQPTTEELWRDLCQYEAPSGWIWRIPGEGEAAQFHSEVVGPMRELLWHQSVFGTLQRAAVEYFERLAEKQPGRWAEWICEAVFHRFQLEGAAADAYWLEHLRSPRALADPEGRRRIASEVLRGEYAEDEREPVRRGDAGQPIISPATLTAAHVESARAMLAIDGYVTAVSPEWAELQRHVTLARQLADNGSTELLDPAVDASVEAVELVRNGQFDTAAALLTQTLHDTADLESRFRLTYQLADVLAALRQSAASEHYRNALELHPGPRTGVTVTQLWAALGALYLGEGQPLSATDAYRQAFATADTAGTRERMAHQLIWVALKAGDYDGAARLLDERHTSESLDAPAFHRLAAWLALALEDPERARESAERARAAARNDEDEGRAHDVVARACASAMDIAGALRAWELAVQLFARTTAPNAIESSLIDQIALKARVLGNYKEAAAHLSEAERLPGMRDAEVGARVALERLFVSVRTGDRQNAEATLRRLMSPRDPAWPVALRARVLAEGLALELVPASDENLTELWELLAEIRPASARLEVVEPFGDCERPLSNTPFWRQRFLSLFRTPDPRKPSFAGKALRMADVHRVFSSSDHATRLLHAVGQIFAAKRNIWGILRVVDGLRRQGAPVKPLFEAVPTTRRASSFAEAVLLLERTYADVGAGTLPTPAVIRQIEQGVSAEAPQTKWHARLLELQLTVAAMRGDADACAFFRTSAASAYRLLGDDASAARVESAGSDTDGTPPSEAGAVEPLPTSRSRSRSRSIPAPAKRLHPKLDPPASERRRTVVLNPAQPGASALGELAAAGKLEAVADWLVSDDAVARIEALLPPAFFASREEVKLQCSAGILSAVPWEWAHASAFVWRASPSAVAMPAVLTRWVQTALHQLDSSTPVDGVYGPVTAKALARFGRSAGVDDKEAPPELLARLRRAAAATGAARGTVLVVQPRGHSADADEAGLESAVGMGIGEVYRRAGWAGDLHVLREPDLDEFHDTLIRQRPDILHIICTVKDRSGLAFLDFARRDRKGGDVITASSLHRLLMSISDSPPFIILDLTRPSGRWEAAYALLLRNQLAADLLSLGGLPGILATGFADSPQVTTLGEAIARSLIPGASLRDLALAVRSAGGEKPDSFSERVTFAGAALFAAEPEMPLLNRRAKDDHEHDSPAQAQ